MSSATTAADRRFGRLLVAEWITLLGTFLACFLFLLYRIEALEAKQDVRIQELRAERQAQSDRTDRLYEMFCELLKEQRSKP